MHTKLEETKIFHFEIIKIIYLFIYFSGGEAFLEFGKNTYVVRNLFICRRKKKKRFLIVSNLIQDQSQSALQTNHLELTLEQINETQIT